MPKIDETRPFLAVNIAVMTVSDTRTEADDTSGQAISDLATRDGHRIVERAIIKDDEVIEPNKVIDGEEILKWQLDNRHRPCNLVELMPRLEEHRR